ncbi:MAG: peptidylprolyl isomerase [Pyrinomonadaceae bacterium]
MRKAFVVVGTVALLLGVAIGACAQQSTIITHISKEDMGLLLMEAPLAQMQAFAAQESLRKEALRQLAETLAMAVEAQRLGLLKDPMGIAQLEFMRTLAIAQAYDVVQRQGKSLPEFASITPEQVEAVNGLPETAEKFANFVKIAQAGKILPPGDIPEAQIARLKQDWIKLNLTAKKAEVEGFDKLRKTQLQVTLQQATLLTQNYQRTLLPGQTNVSNGEVNAYIAVHPEYDIAPLRAKAEDLLLRIRAGEDFATLAKQYTDDPGSKESGGFYDWFGRGRMVKEFENGAFGLRVGNVSGIVETQYGFHIIKTVGHRQKLNKETGKLEEEVQVRHILVSTIAPPDPANPLAPQLSLRDTARAVIEKEKRTRILDGLILSTGVIVPPDWL